MVSRDIPVPLSVTVNVFLSLSATSLIFQSLSPSSRSSLFTELNRILLIASLALLINSRKKISLFEYNECVMRLRICRSSLLNSIVSTGASVVSDISVSFHNLISVVIWTYSSLYFVQYFGRKHDKIGKNTGFVNMMLDSEPLLPKSLWEEW